uniref:Uncharacterized protein n=1 Tax=Caenorhabditis japonica TaxID=281687 RepID=A0A8R1HHF7_CAEJA
MGKRTSNSPCPVSGFVFKKLDHNTVVEERPDIVKKRREYLKKKAELDRQNAYFASYDETWVHEGMSPSRGWQHANSTMYKRTRMVDVKSPMAGPSKGKNRGRRGIVLSILTEDGVIPGSQRVMVSGADSSQQKEDYHGDMNSSTCEDHLKEFLPLLWRMAAAKEFVSRNGGKSAFTVYELDEWADEVEGVTVLRIPPYHFFWNPIEFLLGDLKTNIRNLGSSTDSLPILIYDIDEDGVMRGVCVEETDGSNFGGDEIFGSISEYEDDTLET